MDLKKKRHRKTTFELKFKTPRKDEGSFLLEMWTTDRLTAKKRETNYTEKKTTSLKT